MRTKGWWLYGGACLAIAGVGCSNASSGIQLAQTPPPIGHGICRQVMVADYHGQLASRAVGQALAQALQERSGSESCATVFAVAKNGQILAHATVFGGHADRSMAYRIADARELLIGFLTSVHNWETPTLQINSEEAGSTVLASAAFTRHIGDSGVSYPPYRQRVCVVRGEPDLFVAVSGIPPQAAERIVTFGAASSVARRQQGKSTASR